ncbi:MAG TPA: hypothetical protein VHW03_05115 [Chthoniobacterales bacterium]|nr:hypothetical protein [Chthoniobacterales bacterium]
MGVRIPPGTRVKRVDEAERLFVRQNLLLHLIHDVGEGDAVFRIGESDTAARARMSEGERRWTEDSATGFTRVFHETGGERGWNSEDFVDSGGKRGCHLRDRLRGKVTALLQRATACEQGVELA